MALAFGYVEHVAVGHLAEQNPPKTSEFGLGIRLLPALPDFEDIVSAFEVGAYDDRYFFGANVRYGQSSQVEPFLLHYRQINLTVKCVHSGHHQCIVNQILRPARVVERDVGVVVRVIGVSVGVPRTKPAGR